MLRYLVVANQTLVSAELLDVVSERLRRDDSAFHIVVPATPLPERGAWTHGWACAVARERLDQALKQFADLGADATGEVGDANPMAAIADSLLAARYDAIILSTLAPGRSDWLRHDLPSRAARAFHLPVAHVIAERIPVVMTRPGG